jgi:hypothetical protein
MLAFTLFYCLVPKIVEERKRFSTFVEIVEDN